MQCCAVYQRKSCEIIFFKECSPLEADEQRKNLNDILIYVNDFKFLSEKQIQKIHTHGGVWFITLDQRNCCHMAYCQKNYPEKPALRFLSQLKRLICGVNQYDQHPENIERFLSHRIYNLIKGYNADVNYDDDYQDTEKSVQSITVDVQEINASPQRNPKNAKSSFFKDSPNKIDFSQSHAPLYPKPTTSNQFNEYLCYGSLLLLAFLMLVLMIIKIN